MTKGTIYAQHMVTLCLHLTACMWVGYTSQIVFSFLFHRLASLIGYILVSYAPIFDGTLYERTRWYTYYGNTTNRNFRPYVILCQWTILCKRTTINPMVCWPPVIMKRHNKSGSGAAQSQHGLCAWKSESVHIQYRGSRMPTVTKKDYSSSRRDTQDHMDLHRAWNSKLRRRRGICRSKP